MVDSVAMLVSRTGLSPVMVGRGAELARLLRLLDHLAEPRVALVGGEAGVGKTRLVQELLTVLPDGVTVLAGQAEQGGPGRPYQLLLEAVGPFVADWAALPEQLAGREPALRPLLAPVAPALAAGVTPQRAGPSGADPAFPAEALLRGAVDLVRHLAAPASDGPGGGLAPAAVIVLEDLHWADPDSLTLLSRLASTPGLPVLLLGTYRTEAVGRRLTDLMVELERRRSVEHITLRRLRRVEVIDLLGAVYRRPIAATVAEALHQRTAGNPFYIEELLVAAGNAPPEELPSLPLPANLTEALLRHLDGLDAEQRRVVDAAAVLGQRIPFDLLAVVTGSGEEELIGVLRALVGRGLIVEEDTDVFSFRHALTREAVSSRLLGRERRRLHEKALAGLREQGSRDWGALAHHAAGAGRWDEVLDAARAGARHYLHGGSTFQALHLAELALEEADADLELLELAVRAAWAIGLPERAVERAERWRRLAEAAGRDADLARALRLLARLRWELGDLEANRRLVQQALAVAERLEPSEEQVLVYNAAAESAGLADDLDGAVTWADRALALAGQVGASALVPAILVNKGSALLWLAGHLQEGASLLERVIAEGETHGEPIAVLRAYNNLLMAMRHVWPPERSHALLDQWAAAVERHGRFDWLPSVSNARAMLLAEAEGDLPAARAALSGLPEPGADTRTQELFWAVVLDAELSLEAGDLAEAELRAAQAHGGTILSNDPERHLSERRLEGDALAARVAAAGGHLDEAVDLLEGLLRRAKAATSRPAWLPTIWCEVLRGALRSGLEPGEVRRLQRSVPATGRSSSPLVDPAWPDHLEGAIAEAEGEHERALAAYQGALAQRGYRRPPPVVADAHQGCARCLLALGRYEQARAHAEEAMRLLARWPGWRRAEAEALLRRLGGGQPASGPQTLTPREREVAALVTEGLSNAEVARRLYISPKTASVHVSNILTKLGMSSRTEIAAWATREGLGKPAASEH
jgi:DNA-binding CsgD family transcriptional regulator